MFFLLHPRLAPLRLYLSNWPIRISVLMTHLSVNYLSIVQLFGGKSLPRYFDIRGTQTMELNIWAQGYSQFEEIYSHSP